MNTHNTTIHMYEKNNEGITKYNNIHVWQEQRRYYKIQQYTCMTRTTDVLQNTTIYMYDKNNGGILNAKYKLVLMREVCLNRTGAALHLYFIVWYTLIVDDPTAISKSTVSLLWFVYTCNIG
jgi:hypothetical protein